MVRDTAFSGFARTDEAGERLATSHWGLIESSSYCQIEQGDEDFQEDDAIDVESKASLKIVYIGTVVMPSDPGWAYCIYSFRIPSLEDRLPRFTIVGQELEIGPTQGFPWIWIAHDQVSKRLMNKFESYILRSRGKVM